MSQCIQFPNSLKTFLMMMEDKSVIQNLTLNLINYCSTETERLILLPVSETLKFDNLNLAEV